MKKITTKSIENTISVNIISAEDKEVIKMAERLHEEWMGHQVSLGASIAEINNSINDIRRNTSNRDSKSSIDFIERGINRSMKSLKLFEKFFNKSVKKFK